jgi:hypothetical protein
MGWMVKKEHLMLLSLYESEPMRRVKDKDRRMVANMKIKD